METQLNECVPGMQDAIIAYEPIWSIGSGLVPTSKEILEVNKFVKKYLIEKKNYKSKLFIWRISFI